MVIRNPLKRGMDFVAGAWDFVRVTITDKDEGIVIDDEQDRSGTHQVVNIKDPNGTNLKLAYNTQYGFLNVIDADGGGQVFRIDLTSGNIAMRQDGTGIEVTSPDGTVTKTYGVRNDGTWGELP